MLSRRDLFRASAAVGAGVALGGLVAAPAALAAGHGGVFDMTHTLDADFPAFFNEPGISMNKIFDFAANGFNLFDLTIREHIAIHIDAPLHFSADGLSVDEIPVTDLVVALCKIDIAAKAAENPDAQVTPDDLAAWIAANGPIPERACVAMYSGWAEKLGGDGFAGRDGAGGLHFPGFQIEATQMLLETGAAAIAVDTLSLDHGPSGGFFPPTMPGCPPGNRGKTAGRLRFAGHVVVASNWLIWLGWDAQAWRFLSLSSDGQAILSCPR